MNKILFYVCHSQKTRRQTISHVLHFLVFSLKSITIHHLSLTTDELFLCPLDLIRLYSTSFHRLSSTQEFPPFIYRNLYINLLSPILKLLFFGSMPFYFFPEKLLPSHKDLSLAEEEKLCRLLRGKFMCIVPKLCG